MYYQINVELVSIKDFNKNINRIVLIVFYCIVYLAHHKYESEKTVSVMWPSIFLNSEFVLCISPMQVHTDSIE